MLPRGERVRLFESLPLIGPNCGADMRIIAFVAEAVPVQRILNHIGKPTEPPPNAPGASALRCPAPLGYQPKPSWFGHSLLQHSSSTRPGG